MLLLLTIVLNFSCCDRSETLSFYAKLLVELDHMTKRMVFDGYGLDKRHCDSLLESTNYMLRSFKYRLPQKDENNLGLHAHTDTSFFTILHQNNVNGLQVKLKNGEWVDIDLSPFMLLILAGDAFKVGHFSDVHLINQSTKLLKNENVLNYISIYSI